MGKTVRKKILPKYYEDVNSGCKNFEIRKDENDIEAGDELVLEEWSREIGYTGRSVIRTVSYVLRNVPEYGLKEGYCIISWGPAAGLINED